MNKKQVLVVEDEEDILNLVEYNLSNNGFDVKGVGTGEDALRVATKEKPDLIILDLMLPGVDGIEVCRSLKSGPDTQKIPIIMLTARSEEADVVSGLELGADDYITKPFSPRVLVARSRAVLRREKTSKEAQAEMFKIHGMEIHRGRHEVYVRGRSVDLTFTEFGVLDCLSRKPGWVFSRQQIIDSVRGNDYPVTDRSVDFQIVQIRKKLGECAKYIETVRGVGYRMKD